MKEVEEVIAEVLVELDKKHADYQRLHRFFHVEDDEEAKHTHSLLIGVCDDIRARLKRKR
jgi:hypothetical protein